MHARWSRVRGDVARFSREHLLRARIVSARVHSRVLARSHRLQDPGAEYRLEPVGAVVCWIKSRVLFANASPGGACVWVLFALSTATVYRQPPVIYCSIRYKGRSPGGSLTELEISREYYLSMDHNSIPTAFHLELT